jgi:hypothetical protein
MESSWFYSTVPDNQSPSPRSVLVQAPCRSALVQRVIPPKSEPCNLYQCNMADDRGQWLMVLTGMFFAWSSLIFLVRVWAKIRTKTWSIDDYCLSTAVVRFLPSFPFFFKMQ